MSIRRSSLICVAYLQVYERVADNRWWPNIGGLLYKHAGIASVNDCECAVYDVMICAAEWWVIRLTYNTEHINHCSLMSDLTLAIIFFNIHQI